MGKLLPPRPGKLFIGMIARDSALFAQCTERFAEMYGPVDIRSEILPWEHSDYYRDEMGSGLRRMFVFFQRLIDPGDLASIKHAAIRLEAELSCDGPSGPRRTINIDPGYITEAKVVLATSKDFPHRIYIGNRIYAESTLHYSRIARSFIPVEHTYPDFRTEYCLNLFGNAREHLRTELS